MRHLGNVTPTLAVAAGCSLLFAACDGLNLEPPAELGSDAVWSDPGLTEAYLNDVYSGIGYGYGGVMISSVADEAKHTHGWDDAPMRLSNMTPTDRGLWQRGDEAITKFRWDLVYARIRDLNTLIQNVEAGDALPVETKEAMLGEADGSEFSWDDPAHAADPYARGPRTRLERDEDGIQSGKVLGQGPLTGQGAAIQSVAVPALR